jgi:hypothetical protein
MEFTGQTVLPRIFKGECRRCWSAPVDKGMTQIRTDDEERGSESKVVRPDSSSGP